MGRWRRTEYGEAARWSRKAADHGVADAQFNLGVAYLWGHGVVQDYAEAVRWTRIAAEQGDVFAQNSLGSMYADGQGVPQDFVRAHMWLNLAAAEGVPEAAQDRDGLESRMTHEQVTEAQRLAREWKPKK